MVLLNTEDAAITEATTVLEAHKALELPALDYAKVDEELFASSGIRIACAACSVHFQPRLGFDISIRESRLEHLRLGLAGPFSAQLQVKAETTLPATKLQQEIPLLNRSQTFVQLVGPLPLVAKVDTEWVATVEGTWNSHGSVAFRFDTNRSLDLSLVREAGAWHGVSQADGSWSFESPILETVQQGEGSLTLRAKAKLTLMAVASTTFVTEAHGQATWSVLPPPMTWSANTALRVGAEASLQIPHLVDKTWSGTLFHTEQMWASSKTGLPVPFREAASPQSVRQSLLAASP
jgi:hypothetical protein